MLTSLAAIVWLASPAAVLAQDAEHGATLFDELECSDCHAAGGTGGMGPAVAGTTLSLEAVVSQLRNPRGMMPAYGADRLSDEDIADIYAWLQEQSEEPVFPTWFSSDLINLPTPMMPGRKMLEVHFTHRFTEPISDAGRQGLWGLDSFAVPTFWFAYGVTDWLQVHGGRSSNRATWEYGGKIELLAEDRLSIPISASAVVGGAYLDNDNVPNKSRLTAEFPIGWRAHDRVSVVAVPFLATNPDPSGNPDSDTYSTAFGLGGTFRITPGHSIDVEWVTNLGGFKVPEAVDQWQVFWGIKVGGHVFQLGVTNAFLYTPDQMAPGARQTGRKGDVRIGFNLVRAFQLGGG